MDGILYSILEMAAETATVDVGKYGRMWIEHIKVVYPERYRCLVRFGELTERASQVNETAYELLENIEVRWLRKHKPKNPNSFMEQLHLRNQARQHIPFLPRIQKIPSYAQNECGWFRSSSGHSS